ncbi:hypothetical protein, partial [Aurantimonas sp. C2-4-R8]|nr:hypothetical protein [Aurantimonas sp. C2-4-R8]
LGDFFDVMIERPLGGLDLAAGDQRYQFRASLSVAMPSDVKEMPRISLSGVLGAIGSAMVIPPEQPRDWLRVSPTAWRAAGTS